AAAGKRARFGARRRPGCRDARRVGQVPRGTGRASGRLPAVPPRRAATRVSLHQPHLGARGDGALRRGQADLAPVPERARRDVRAGRRDVRGVATRVARPAGRTGAAVGGALARARELVRAAAGWARALARNARRATRLRSQVEHRDRPGVRRGGRAVPAPHLRVDGARDGVRGRRPAGHLGGGRTRPHALVTLPLEPPAARPSRLRLGPLVAVMFFTVSGGPFGLEGLVGSVGPGVALVLLVATPLLYSVPETLLV